MAYTHLGVTSHYEVYVYPRLGRWLRERFEVSVAEGWPLSQGVPIKKLSARIGDDRATFLAGGVVGLGCRVSEAVHPYAEVHRRLDGVGERHVLDFALPNDPRSASYDEMSA